MMVVRVNMVWGAQACGIEYSFLKRRFTVKIKNLYSEGGVILLLYELSDKKDKFSIFKFL